jgi:hypothetical protein
MTDSRSFIVTVATWNEEPTAIGHDFALAAMIVVTINWSLCEYMGHSPHAQKSIFPGSYCVVIYDSQSLTAEGVASANVFIQDLQRLRMNLHFEFEPQ